MLCVLLGLVATGGGSWKDVGIMVKLLDRCRESAGSEVYNGWYVFSEPILPSSIPDLQTCSAL